MATPRQAQDLRKKGFTVTAPYGEEKAAKAAPPDPFATNPTHGFNVYRPWHLKPAPCPGTCSGAVDSAGQPINLQTWYENQRAANPDIVKKVVYGKSRYGQDLVAYKVSANPHALADGAKPVVWYESTQHAREWIATETIRRLFGHVLANRDQQLDRRPGAAARHGDVVRAGRQRRRLRLDLPAEGHPLLAAQPAPTTTTTTSSTSSDGVDTNRNWAEKWRYDQEGAADVFEDDTYRGPSPQSEPEVAALDAMYRQAQAEVPDRLPLLRAADAVPRGLAGRDLQHRLAGHAGARGLG